MPRYAAKVDANQRQIVDTLRSVGATVQSLATMGHGMPDLAVGFQGRNYFVEVKHGKGKLTSEEQEWHNIWRGQVAIVRSPDEALKLIGAIEQ
jgi:hypothetical protein